MKVKEVMTKDAEYLPTDTSLREAAKKMAELDCGFLPIGSREEDKLKGVITDRDIVLRAIARGLDPNTTTVNQVKTERVLYCFEEDDIETAADSMSEQQVYRLIVLNNDQEKRLCGIITLGDITRHNQENVASRAAKGISHAA